MVAASCAGGTHVSKSASGIPARFPGVSMTEGTTAFTVIPESRVSSAITSVSASTPALATEYGPLPPTPRSPCLAPTLMILPLPRSIM